MEILNNCPLETNNILNDFFGGNFEDDFSGTDRETRSHFVTPNIGPGPTWLQPHTAAARCGLRLRLARVRRRPFRSRGAIRRVFSIQSIDILQVCEISLEIASDFEAFRREGSGTRSPDVVAMVPPTMAFLCSRIFSSHHET